MKSSSPLFHYYRVYAEYAGYKLHLLVFAVLVGGVFEGFGITMLIPLLNEGGVAASEADKATQAVQWLLGLFGVAKTFGSVLFLLAIVFILKSIVTFAHSVLSAHVHASLTQELRTRVIERLSPPKGRLRAYQ